MFNSKQLDFNQKKDIILTCLSKNAKSLCGVVIPGDPTLLCHFLIVLKVLLIHCLALVCKSK